MEAWNCCTADWLFNFHENIWRWGSASGCDCGAVTSTTLLASSASSSKVAVALVEASTMRMFDGSHYRNSSHRKVLSVVLPYHRGVVAIVV